VKTLYNYKYPSNPLKWIISKEVCKSKAEYYELLSRSKVAFSSASQETFGIAMQEAVNMGAWPIAPNKLSYPETLADALSEGLYNTLDQAADNIFNACRHELLPPKHYFMNAESIVSSIIADMEGSKCFL
jgi:hypothetical protein